MLDNLKHIAARHFSGEFRNVESYSPDELSRAKEAIIALDYKELTDTAYSNEHGLHKLTHHYEKTDNTGKITGLVSIFTDPNNTGFVADGIVSIGHDHDLMEKAGKVATIHDFAFRMNPTKKQKTMMALMPFLKP